MTNETFSDRLKLAMQAKQFKQVDLIRAAQRRGVKLGKSHVSQYVSGKTVPRSDILHFLADVLQVDPDWLLAKDSTVKSSIVSAVEAVTGLAVHKIQVFEMGTN